MVGGEGVPRLGLGGLDPGEDVGREEGAGAVVLGGVTVGIQPAVGGEVLADFGLEGDFRVDAHAESRIIDRSKVLILELNIKDVVAVSYCTLCAIAPPKS